MFLSGRRQTESNSTEYNLTSAGYTDYDRLIVRGQEDHDKKLSTFKLEQRARLENEEGLSIVATIGDQWSDFADGSAGVEPQHTGYVVKLPNYMYTVE